MSRPGIFDVTVQIWRKEGEHPMSDGNRNAGREALPAGPERPSITLPAELAVHLGRELSASAVDDNGWTDLRRATRWPRSKCCCPTGQASMRGRYDGSKPLDAAAARHAWRAGRAVAVERRQYGDDARRRRRLPGYRFGDGALTRARPTTSGLSRTGTGIRDGE